MYDQTILDHYARVATEEGSLESCTMADEKIRQIESDFILAGIDYFLKLSGKNDFKVLDIGCGNGYTLELVHAVYPSLNLSGVEFTPELRSLANKKKIPIEVVAGDVRDRKTIPLNQDVIICQRVLINLLNENDQINALANIAESLNEGGILIIIEAFESGLENLNKCRKELGLSEIPPAHHNLYLKDHFFDSIDSLAPVEIGKPKNILSSHYFVTRVLHDIALAATSSKFVRNSLFVSFFDEALPQGVGDFSPLRCYVLEKVR